MNAGIQTLFVFMHPPEPIPDVLLTTGRVLRFYGRLWYAVDEHCYRHMHACMATWPVCGSGNSIEANRERRDLTHITTARTPLTSFQSTSTPLVRTQHMALPYESLMPGDVGLEITQRLSPPDTYSLVQMRPHQTLP